MVKVFCRNTGTFREFPEGTTLLDAVDEFNFDKAYPIVAAKVNNVVQGLRFRLYNNKDIEFLDYRTYSGRSAYCRSLCFLLSKAARDVFPGCRIYMRRPISKGYFCSLIKPDGFGTDADDVARIRKRMHEIVKEDLPFYRQEVQADEATSVFARDGRSDVTKLIGTTIPVYVDYYTLVGSADYYYDTLVPSSGYLDVWELERYRSGMLLRVPDRHHPEQLAPFFEQP